mgnify:CR=1 FL=1
MTVFSTAEDSLSNSVAGTTLPPANPTCTLEVPFGTCAATRPYFEPRALCATNTGTSAGSASVGTGNWHSAPFAPLYRGVRGAGFVETKNQRVLIQTEGQALTADVLGQVVVTHKDGVVDNLPETVDDAKLKATVDKLLATHASDVVKVYLHSFNSMNESQWKNLESILKDDARLQF